MTSNRANTSKSGGPGRRELLVGVLAAVATARIDGQAFCSQLHNLSGKLPLLRLLLRAFGVALGRSDRRGGNAERVEHAALISLGVCEPKGQPFREDSSCAASGCSAPGLGTRFVLSLSRPGAVARHIEYIRWASSAARTASGTGSTYGDMCTVLLDNFESIARYRPRRGLMVLDRATQRRFIEPRPFYSGTTARSNGRTAQVRR